MNISILGCGWLGLPLAEHLRDRGHTVKGSTTSADKMELLKGKEITPYLLELDPAPPDGHQRFWDSDAVIVTIPPAGASDNGNSYFLQQMQQLADRVRDSSTPFLIYTSSTSVYPPQPGVVDEADARPGGAARPIGEWLLEAENMLMSHSGFDATVIRFGGLYGYDRHPVLSLSGRKDLGKGNAPINLIHRDDCIGLLRKVIEEQVTGEIFNGVSDGHPPRSMYYPAVAQKLDVEPPTFKEEEGQDYKVVSNRKVKQLLQYRFKYPNPMDF